MDAPLPGDTLGCHRREQPAATVDGKVFERPVGQVVDHHLKLADHEANQLRRVNRCHIIMYLIAHPGHVEDGFHHNGILAAAKEILPVAKFVPKGLNLTPPKDAANSPQAK